MTTPAPLLPIPARPVQVALSCHRCWPAINVRAIAVDARGNPVCAACACAPTERRTLQ